jgi:hypothetical protein
MQMPYLRLYLPEISITRKRQLAQKLIKTTLRTFQLRASDRDQITIQFLPEARAQKCARCRVEVAGHDLAPANKQAFAQDVTPVLLRSLQLDGKSRLAAMVGIKTERPPQVDVSFLELPPDCVAPGRWAVGDDLAAAWNRAA